MKLQMYLPEASSFVVVKEISEGVFYSSRNIYAGENKEGRLVGSYVGPIVRASTKRKRPEGAGRKKKDGRIVGPFRLATDVADILNTVPDKTAYIEQAIRHYNASQ